MASFKEQIGAWASATEERIDAVHNTALEKLAREMTRTKAEGGNVPFDTGNLYRSLRASTVEMPKTVDGPNTGRLPGGVIASLKPGQAIFLGYQAAYARRQNFGYVGADRNGRVYNQPGNHFVERAIGMWSQLVFEAVTEVRANAIS